MPIDPRIVYQFLEEDDLSNRLLLLDYVQDNAESQEEIDSYRKEALSWMGEEVAEAYSSGNGDSAADIVMQVLGALNVPYDQDKVFQVMGDLYERLSIAISEQVDMDHPEFMGIEDYGELEDAVTEAEGEYWGDSSFVRDYTYDYMKRKFPRFFNLEGTGKYQKKPEAPPLTPPTTDPSEKSLRMKYKSLRRYYW